MILAGSILLKKHRLRLNLSIHAFSRAHGFDPSDVSKLERGRRAKVGLELAARIEDATQGAVPMRSWIPPRSA